MKFVDLLFFLLALTFFPLHEGILARTSSWARVADAIDPRALKPLGWRQNDAIARDLGILDRHFLFASVVCLALVMLALKLPVLFIWVSAAGFVSLFAWIAFRWSFNEAEALRQLAPVVAYSLIPAWAFLMIDYAGPKVGLFTTYAEKLWFLKYTSYTPFQIAGYAFMGVAALLVAYYLFAWFIFQPLAWLLLVCLKGSRLASAWVARKAGQDVLFPASVAVQAFGVIYFFWISRHL